MENLDGYSSLKNSIIHNLFLKERESWHNPLHNLTFFSRLCQMFHNLMASRWISTGWVRIHEFFQNYIRRNSLKLSWKTQMKIKIIKLSSAIIYFGKNLDWFWFSLLTSFFKHDLRNFTLVRTCSVEICSPTFIGDIPAALVTPLINFRSF